MHAELTWLVNYLLFSESLEAIDPAVANTVTELLLLPVENMLWKGEHRREHYSSENCEHRVSEETHGAAVGTFGR
jgi:hypothetical protein